MKMSSEPNRYVKKPVEIQAFELKGYGDFVRAEQWVTANGGRARFSKERTVKLENGNTVHFPDQLLIDTIEGTMEAGVGWFIIQGILGEFYPCKGDIFRLSYDPVQEESFDDPELPGTYQVGRHTKSGNHLVGGAALALPT